MTGLDSFCGDLIMCLLGAVSLSKTKTELLIFIKAVNMVHSTRQVHHEHLVSELFEREGARTDATLLILREYQSLWNTT